jgi:hypothetical protein
MKEDSVSRTPKPSVKKRHIEKKDLLLVFQKRRLRLDTKSKCQYDIEVHRRKKSHMDDDLIFVFKKQTYN